MAIDREQLLHVAHLARLELRDDELERLGAQLNDILDAVSKVVGARPLGRAADLAPARRRQRLGRGRAAPVPPGRGGARERARARGRRTSRSRPEARDARHPAPDAPRRRRASSGTKEVSGAELYAAYRAAIDERDPELHCYLHVCEDDGGEGIPIAVKDVIGTKGIPTTAGSKILEGYVPGLRRDCGRSAARRTACAILGKTNTDEFAMGSSTENSAYGPTQQPVGPDARARRLGRRLGGCRGGRASRRGRSAPTRAARSSSPPRSAATSACVRPTARSRATASSRSRRASTRSARSRGTSATARSSTRSSRAATRATRRRSTCRARCSCPKATRSPALRVGVPKEFNEHEAIEPGVREAVAAHDRALPRARRRGGGVLAAALASSTACRATT